jgi:hypothetical protein
MVIFTGAAKRHNNLTVFTPILSILQTPCFTIKQGGMDQEKPRKRDISHSFMD